LFNNRGVIKPQHGVLPTEHGEKQAVTISTALPIQKANEWLTGANVEVRRDEDRSRIGLTVPAGGVRIVELR